MSFPPGTEMFQFPGFASLGLCIQPKDTWFCPLMNPHPPPGDFRPQVAKRQDNNGHSGGLPHSEIDGSKPIPGSPSLIAGYHVLHRLLLPRHPPNALLALDPIQRRTGPYREGPFAKPPRAPPPHGFPARTALVGSHTSLAPAGHPKGPSRRHAVSVLDLDTDPPRGSKPQMNPHSGPSAVSDALSSRCSISVRLDGPAPSGARQSSPSRNDTPPKTPTSRGGACRDRTDDPLLAKQVLSRLS
jgi:hypothetical protein